MRTFDPLFVSLAEVALNVLFVVLLVTPARPPRTPARPPIEPLMAQIATLETRLAEATRRQAALDEAHRLLRDERDSLAKELEVLRAKRNDHRTCEAAGALMRIKITGRDNFEIDGKQHTIGSIRWHFSTKTKAAAIRNENCIHLVEAIGAAGLGSEDYIEASTALATEFRVRAVKRGVSGER